MTTALIFPGQGSQTIGMGLALNEAFPVAKHVFEEVDDALGQKLSTLMFSGDADELMQTQNAQPAIMAVGMAVVKVLESETGKNISELAGCVAGHSLGEYTALCAAGALNITDTAKLLRLRGLAMAEAAKENVGGMAAILALTKDQIAEVIANTDLKGQICVMANDNCPGQIVISGQNEALEAVMAGCQAAGAKRAIKLAVSGGFHSPLMQSAADKMREVLAETPLQNPIVPVVSNVLAEPVQEAEQIKELLVRQVTGSVLWTDSMHKMVGDMGINHFVECGNGKVLAGLVKKTYPDIPVFSLGTPADIDTFLK
ncbi:MAG: ACP S-malonyltransferase [Alphaproteobacteria bacterium]|nr:ACP S-malonyltransferase [Alphaproteobacteria bacterium]